MAVPTKEELADKQQRAAESHEMSDIQFSAHITAEYIEGQESAGDIPPQSDDLIRQAERAQDEITRRDREILDALDKVLQKSAAEPAPVRQKSSIKLGRLAVGTIRRGAGLVSLALSLIFLGIVSVCVMASGTPDRLLIAKLAPLTAVFVGAELLISWLVSGRKLRVNIPCVCVTAFITIGSCILAASLSSTEKLVIEEYNSRMVSAEIYDASYSALRHTADISKLTVTAELDPDSKARSIDTLSAGDHVRIDAVLDGRYSTPAEFAADCGHMIRVYKDLGIPVDTFCFSAETRLAGFFLTVEGKFQQDFSDEKLTELVNYIYYEDYDYIQDLDDMTEETSEYIID